MNEDKYIPDNVIVSVSWDFVKTIRVITKYGAFAGVCIALWRSDLMVGIFSYMIYAHYDVIDKLNND